MSEPQELNPTGVFVLHHDEPMGAMEAERIRETWLAAWKDGASQARLLVVDGGMKLTDLFDEERLQRAADAAYGAFYPHTATAITGKERAWRGDPAHNPLLRPFKAALTALLEEAR
jgi:hypothetical protein